MTATEKRIRQIELKAKGDLADYCEAMVSILCEIGRELARLRALYEIELGLEDPPSSTGPGIEEQPAAAPQFSSEFLAGNSSEF